jgi:hypothetical protein
LAVALDQPSQALHSEGRETDDLACRGGDAYALLRVAPKDLLRDITLDPAGRADRDDKARCELNPVVREIEAQPDIGVAWAGVFVDGEQRPSALMGPTRYYQSVSADITDLMPGIHSVWVIAVDSEGRMGGYAWTFAVV